MNKSENNETLIVLLTKGQCESIIDFIELDLLNYIRRDEYIDNIEWVKNIIAGMEAMQNVINLSESTTSVPDSYGLKTVPLPYIYPSVSCGEVVIPNPPSEDNPIF